MNTTAENWGNLKIYQTLTFVLTSDWDLYTTTATPSEINRIAEKSKFIQLWNDYINTSFIRKIFTKQVDEVDNAILGISDKDLRARLQSEIDKRRKDWYRVNMEVFKNILNRLSE